MKDEEVILRIVERPSQNPDLILIELLWEEMDRRDKLKKLTSYLDWKELSKSLE